MSAISNIGGFSGTQYPMYSGSVRKLSDHPYKVCETSTGLQNGPNIVTMSNADGDTITLSALAKQLGQSVQK